MQSKKQEEKREPIWTPNMTYSHLRNADDLNPCILLSLFLSVVALWVTLSCLNSGANHHCFPFSNFSAPNPILDQNNIARLGWLTDRIRDWLASERFFPKKTLLAIFSGEFFLLLRERIHPVCLADQAGLRIIFWSKRNVWPAWLSIKTARPG